MSIRSQCLIHPAPLINTLAKMQLRAKNNGNLLNKVIFLLKNNQFAAFKLLDLSTRMLLNLGTDTLKGNITMIFNDSSIR